MDALARDIPTRMRIDPWLVIAAVCFVVAVAAAAYPAFRHDPWSAPGLILIVTLAAMALVGVLAFGRVDAGERRRVAGDAAVELLDAMAEPAALVWSGGRVLAYNAAWAEAGGATTALPRGRSASSLYMAFAQARNGEPGRATLRVGDRDIEVLIGAAGDGRFLVRQAPEAVLAGPGPAQPARLPAADVGYGRAMAAGAPFGSGVIADDDLFGGKVSDANPALAELTGPAAARDAAFGDLFMPQGVEEARNAMGKGSNGPIELTARAFPKRTLHLYVAAEGEGRRVWLFDVTAQKSAESQLAQVQKMQAVGQLAAGIAHDVNNILSAIALRAEDLMLRHPVGDPSYDGLNIIRQQVSRGAGMIRQLLAFSRRETVQRQRLELGGMISNFTVMLRRMLPEDMRLETDYGRDLPVVIADLNQMESAVMNLAVNARDAMRGSVAPGAGVLTIRTRRLTGAEARELGWAGAPAADVAMIEVSDTGPGVPPELLDKIFEPFFTTKPVGSGTGLGLASIYGIMEQSGGHAMACNLTGADGATTGAAFRMFLPAAGEVVAESVETPRPRPKPKAAPRDLSGAGRILFAEDESAVRLIAAKLLRQRGYEVIEAADGEEALELAERHGGEIDMLISDVIMPGMDGPTLLKKARPYLGDAPVMFISGYAESDFSDLLADAENDITFLPKPLDIKTLAERVKQALHAA